ncbi:MAG: hypothetical protein N2507_00855 [Candidatus Bipolaricaulota bacterium]|nr:hypothetical protein [Candidatus Bipolaricaulota bacterium]
MEAGVKLGGMFTGIVRAVGQVRERTARRIWVSREGLPAALGASVAVNGVCLTVAELADEAMAFDLSGRPFPARTWGSSGWATG